MEKQHKKHLDSLPIKKRSRYKNRRWKGHSYGWKLIVHVGYLLQCYNFAYTLDGKPIRPSKATLAKQVGICIRTLDTALQALKEMGLLTWVSGKKNFATNTYSITRAWAGIPMRMPEDFTVPKYLWLKMQYMLKKEKFKKFRASIYEHISRNFTDHLLHREKYLRVCLLNSSKNSLKASKDPPKRKKRRILWYLLKPFELSTRDNIILSRYGEATLKSAIEDHAYYLDQGNSIDNTPAFLIHRCKEHKQKLEGLSKAIPSDTLEWIKARLKTSKAKYISSEGEILRDSSNLFTKLMICKSDVKKSVLYLWKKINGTWIDKQITIDHPRFEELVEPFLKQS